MMGWREYAKQVQRAGDNRDIRDARGEDAANVPIVPSVSPLPPLDAGRAIRQCKVALARLDWDTPPAGMRLGRWQQLIDDAEWLIANFAEQAFRDGWTMGELFGRWPEKNAWGGIADRLQSSRSLKMTADRAHWRCAATGEPMQFNRTAYSDLRPFWETDA